jgi:transketolase
MHLSGFDVSIDDLKKFRKLGSKTAGHPENFLINGIDATTGPLGQGVANAVGLEIGEKYLADRYNVDGVPLINNYTYCLFGDGCFQEGVSFESFAIAGKLKLNKLVMIFDSNGIQLDSSTLKTTNIDHKQYFESLGFNYVLVENGDNVSELVSAFEICKNQKEKPSIIEVKTIIGKGAKEQNTFSVHGSPLSKDEVSSLRQLMLPNTKM